MKSDGRIHIEPDFSVEYQYSGFRSGFIIRLVLEACRVVPSTIFGRYSRTCICIHGSSQKSVCKHTFWMAVKDGGDIATQHRETFIA